MPEHTVRSPLPGVFYRRPAPDQPTFVEEGSTVSADQTIGLVEIMKQYQEVKAGADGSLTAFVAEDQSVLGAGDAVATVDVS